MHDSVVILTPGMLVCTVALQYSSTRPMDMMSESTAVWAPNSPGIVMGGETVSGSSSMSMISTGGVEVVLPGGGERGLSIPAADSKDGAGTGEMSR